MTGPRTFGIAREAAGAPLPDRAHRYEAVEAEAGPGDSAGPAADAPERDHEMLRRRERADLVAYIADMLDGLGTLAQQAGNETLIALLKLAHAEATLEQGRLDPRARP